MMFVRVLREDAHPIEACRGPQDCMLIIDWRSGGWHVVTRRHTGTGGGRRAHRAYVLLELARFEVEHTPTGLRV